MNLDELQHHIASLQLPCGFIDVVAEHYLPLAQHIKTNASVSTPFVVGINGLQGTGKSTMSLFLS